MKPLNLSNLMHVAELRYIQSVHERGELKGPDSLVRKFLPTLRRWRLRWLDQGRLATARSDPFYYYLVARTKYYDELFCNAINNGCKYVVNVGCGRDTRSYRFEQLLKRNHVEVLECDQGAAIEERQIASRRFGSPSYIAYAPVDLNAEAQPELEKWLGQAQDGKVFFMMEGVSPYISGSSFTRYLGMLANKLPSGSLLAYDFKVRGLADDPAGPDEQHDLFRLSAISGESAAFHKGLGLNTLHSEMGPDLTLRLLPSLAGRDIELFKQDCVTQLVVI